MKNPTTAIFLINDKVRAITGTYESGDTAPRTMFKTMDPDIAKDDFVIVPTDTRHKMTVVKVVDVDVDVDFESDTHIAWIVGTVDRKAFEAVCQQEGVALAAIRSAEKTRRRDELRRDLIKDAEGKLEGLAIVSIPALLNKPPEA